MTLTYELTYTGILLLVFANQICLPIPSVIILMDAGALAARGEMRASIIVALSVLACLVADGIWFWLGRRWGFQAVRLLCRAADDPAGCSRNAHQIFRRHGLRVLCVAKFLPGLDGITPPLVGAEGIRVPVFLLCDAVGAALWAAVYVGLGYVFANQVEIAISWAQRFGTILAIAIGLPIIAYAAGRGLILLRMVRRLRFRTITPAMLDRKFKSGKEVAVIDLSRFEDEVDEDKVLEAIPGAFAIDPDRLRNSPRIDIPNDVEIVLYCSSRRDIVSARVAVALSRIGVNKVFVLEGGLKSWRELGFPVSTRLELPEVVAQRLGVSLPEMQS